MQNRRNTTTNKTDDLADYIVTEEDYKADLGSGLSRDEVMKPGTYKARRSPWADRLKNAKKIKVSIYLDSDVVQYFRGRADKANAAPYQTQINNELRKVMEGDFPKTRSVEHDILKDKKFLKALKTKLENI